MFRLATQEITLYLIVYRLVLSRWSSGNYPRLRILRARFDPRFRQDTFRPPGEAKKRWHLGVRTN